MPAVPERLSGIATKRTAYAHVAVAGGCRLPRGQFGTQAGFLGRSGAPTRDGQLSICQVQTVRGWPCHVRQVEPPNRCRLGSTYHPASPACLRKDEAQPSRFGNAAGMSVLVRPGRGAAASGQRLPERFSFCDHTGPSGRSSRRGAPVFGPNRDAPIRRVRDMDWVASGRVDHLSTHAPHVSSSPCDCSSGLGSGLEESSFCFTTPRLPATAPSDRESRRVSQRSRPSK